MIRQARLFDIDERLKDLSAKGDDLERLNSIVDFELFRPDLEHAVPRSDDLNPFAASIACNPGLDAESSINNFSTRYL